MSTSTTAPSPTACLDCGAPLADRDVAGEALSECTSCGSLRVGRGALNRLRGVSPEVHPLLAASPLDPPSHTVPRPGVMRRCPICQAALLSHPFGGGNVRVESCDGCELVFLLRKRLAAIVKEAREGIQMSDDARAALHQHRILAAGKRFSAADLGLTAAVLTTLLLFLRIVVGTGFSTTAVVAGALTVGGVLVHRQLKWRGLRAQAAAEMDRLASEELARLDKRSPTEPDAPPPSPASPARPSAPRDSASPLTEAPKTPARTSRSRTCPVCRAPLPAGTTYCRACDSDFG